MSWALELLKAIGLTVVIFTFLAVVTAMIGVYAERKIAGWIQARLAPSTWDRRACCRPWPTR